MLTAGWCWPARLEAARALTPDGAPSELIAGSPAKVLIDRSAGAELLVICTAYPVYEAARTLAEIRARCTEPSERAKEATQRAETALAIAQDRFRRAQALQNTIRATRMPSARCDQRREGCPVRR